MPAPKTQVVRVPLVGVYQNRFDTDRSGVPPDQRFKNVMFSAYKGPMDKEVMVTVERRPGLGLYLTNPTYTNIPYTEMLVPSSVDIPIVALSGGEIWYADDYSLGTVADDVASMSEGILDAGLNTVVFMWTKSNGVYYYNTGMDETINTLTGDVSSGSPTISNVAGTEWTNQEIGVGHLITGTGIPAGTRIKAVDYSANTITMGTDDETTVNGTASNTGVTITYQHIQKVMEASITWPTNFLSRCCWMDGYLFFCTPEGKIYNSDYNNYQVIQQTSYLVATQRPDTLVGLVATKGHIVAIGKTSVEFYKNVGNPQGSVLRRVPEMTQMTSCIPQGDPAQDVSQCPIHQNDKYTVWFDGHNVYMMDNDTLKIEEITDRATGRYIWNEICRGGVSEFACCRVFKWAGKYYVYVGDTSINTSTFKGMLYDVELKLWVETDFGITVFPASSRTSGEVLWASVYAYSGKIWKWQGDTDAVGHVDESTSFTSQIQTARIDFGSNKYKRIRRLTLIGDQSYIQTAALDISWSDDDGQTYNTARQVDMLNNRATITELGVLRRPRFRITTATSENSPIRLEAMEVEYEELAR